ncbi:hypothetical protein ACQ4PT_071352 [Festuca glaucescens]
MRLLRVATCNLNQWAMDFDTNLRNVKESIVRAKTAGAVVRIGPELELTGYGCEDHFLEQDTTAHAWECLKDILSGDYTDNILCSIGMPIIFKSVRYNCQVFCLNRNIIMIRPKMSLANDGNYREFRWFSAWTYKDELVDYQLPVDVSEAISQETVPFGYGYIQFLDVSLAAETCEELFTANAPRIDLAFSGVEVFMNASGSHHQLRKLNLRIDSIRNATRLCGGVYMYANQQGCDGGRLYYDIEKGDEQVKVDAMRIGQYKDGEFPTDSRELAKRLFYTVYMGTENSSEGTRSRAKRLAEEIGSFHFDVPIDSVVSVFLSLFERFTGKRPLYKVDGGSHTEKLGLQNIQARIRMVLAFMMASLMPWVHNKSGFYLVLGSSNVDEGLRGYLTKYDCSSADINPIGSVSKQDLRAFLRWAAVHLQYSSLAEVEAAPPTAELEPIRTDYNQLDEVDMGMAYEELSIYGRLRKIFRCGPVSMFQNLCHRWCGRLSPSEVADKVKHFYKYYAINRHKMTVLTPSYHAESYSPEDNRFDLRQFLYNTAWPYQFRKIDQLVQDIDKDGKWVDSTDMQLRERRAVRSAQGSGMGVVAAGSANPSVGL